jgi:hypothetical protein
MNHVDLSAKNLLSKRTLTEIQDVTQQLMERYQQKKQTEALVYADLAVSLMCRDSLRKNSQNRH